MAIWKQLSFTVRLGGCALQAAIRDAHAQLSVALPEAVGAHGLTGGGGLSADASADL